MPTLRIIRRNYGLTSKGDPTHNVHAVRTTQTSDGVGEEDQI
jgi:hypothetical protein